MSQCYQLASDGWRHKHCADGTKLINYLVNFPDGGSAFLGLEVWPGDKSLNAAAMVEVTEKWMEKVPLASACASLELSIVTFVLTAGSFCRSMSTRCLASCWMARRPCKQLHGSWS